MYHLNMAGIKISIDFKHDAYISAYVKPYLMDDDKTNHQLNIFYIDEMKEPKQGLFRIFARDETGIRSMIVYDSDYKQVDLYIRNQAFNESFLDNLEYIYTGMIFLEISFKYGFLPLHGSVIAYKDEGVMFSAPSGTGKSTHTRFWKERYGDDITYINDDKPLIRIEDGKIYAYGTLFSGEDRKSTNTKVELKSIIYLKQGLTNEMIRFNDGQAAVSLIHNSLRPLDEATWDKVLKQIDHIVSNIPIYELDATKNISAAETVFNKVFGGNHED